MKNTQHIGIWLLIALVGFFLSPFVRTGESMQQFVNAEVQITRDAMGPRVSNMVISFANALFTSTPLQMVAQTAQAAQHSEEDKALSAKVAGVGGQFMSSFYNSYLQGLVMQSYVVAIRFAVVLIWFLFLAPVFIAAVYDGLMQRKIKQAEFGSMRPATFTIAGLLVIPVLTLPVVYLVMPFTVSPLLAPLWAAIVALPLAIMVSNSQPIFGR